MWQKIIDFVKASKPLQYVLIFLAGAIFAVVFYPTKQITESLQKTYEQKIATIQQQDAQTLATQQASYQSLSSEYSNYKVQTDSKINSLTNQVSSLKSHTKVTVYKVVHPDGTTEERDTTENDTDQSEQITEQMQQEWQQKTDQAVQSVTQQYQAQISTLQSQWSSKEQSYQSQIATLSQSKVETINPKNFTLEAGMMTNRDYYGHVNYNVWGPFVVGAHAEFGTTTNSGGLGLGLRF
jgi:hypothetical protein